MDINGRAYSKIFGISYSDVKFEEYRRISDVIGLLAKRHNHETPEMWCSRIRDPFRKILEESFLRMDILECTESYIYEEGKESYPSGRETNYIL